MTDKRPEEMNAAEYAFWCARDEIAALHARAKAVVEERRKLLDSITNTNMQEDFRRKI